MATGRTSCLWSPLRPSSSTNSLIASPSVSWAAKVNNHSFCLPAEKSQARVSFSSLMAFAIAFCRVLEAERDAFAETKPKDSSRHHFNSFLNMSTGTLRDRSEDSTE